MAISIVQRVDVDVTPAASPHVAAFSAGVSAGSFILAIGHFQASAFPIASVSNDKGDTPTDSGLGQPYDNNSICAYIQAFFAPTPGAKTISVALSATGTGHITTYEVAGLSSPSFDAVPAFTLNATTTAIASGPTGTLAAANEFAIAYFTNYVTMAGAGGGFTSDGSTTAAFNAIWMHQITSSTASVTASTTASGVNDGMGLIATIKGTPAGASYLPYNPWPQLGPLVAQRVLGWLPSIPRRPLWTPSRAVLRPSHGLHLRPANAHRPRQRVALRACG